MDYGVHLCRTFQIFSYFVSFASFGFVLSIPTFDICSSLYCVYMHMYVFVQIEKKSFLFNGQLETY